MMAYWDQWRKQIDRRRAARKASDEMQKLATRTFWRRHPAPFAKTETGHKRRQERLFKMEQRDMCFG